MHCVVDVRVMNERQTICLEQVISGLGSHFQR